jgi:hypothetical protein
MNSLTDASSLASDNDTSSGSSFKQVPRRNLAYTVLIVGSMLAAIGSSAFPIQTIYAQGGLDSDGDQIMDDYDACPEDPYNQCYDSNGDGIADSSSIPQEEPVPNVPGSVGYDSNGDGVLDSNYPDVDFDNVADVDDPCPSDPKDLCIDSNGDGVTDHDERIKVCTRAAKVKEAIVAANCPRGIERQGAPPPTVGLGYEGESGVSGTISQQLGGVNTVTYDQSKKCAIWEEDAYNQEFETCMNTPPESYTPPDLGPPPTLPPADEAQIKDDPCDFWEWCVGDWDGDG